MAGAGFKTFTAGEVLTASDVNTYLQEQTVMNFAGTAARASALPSPSEGMVSHIGGGTLEVYDGTTWTGLAGGKILQIVRATDGTQRSTTSTSYVDVTGMSVTITPQKSDSTILIFAIGMWQANHANTGQTNFGNLRITDSSNNQLVGAQDVSCGGINGASTFFAGFTLVGYSTPATTSAVTYKLRFKSETANVTFFARNDQNTGQMYAIEVSA